MWKSVKDARRRIVEKALETVGASEKTVDPDFDAHKKHFDSMVDDMNEVGACLSEMLRNQKVCFDEQRNLATCLARIFVKNEDIVDWPDHENKMDELAGAIAFAEESDYLHNTVRSSAGLAVVETSLEPLRAAVTKMCPEVESIIAVRNEVIADVDAHRRRLRSIEQRVAAFPAKADSLDGELKKFRAKYQNSDYKFKQADIKAKHEILLAKLAHDKLLDMLLITCVVSQQELYMRSAEQMSAIVRLFPEEKVARVRDRINRLVDQGGVHKPIRETGEKSRATRALKVVTGKLALSEAVNAKKKEDKKKELYKQEASRIKNLVAFSSASSANTAALPANDWAQGSRASMDRRPDHVPPPPPALVQTPVAIAALQKPVYVRALWSNPARDKDELTLVEGETIEVVEKPPGAWWRGRDKNGNVGLFPTNYIQEL